MKSSIKIFAGFILLWIFNISFCIGQNFTGNKWEISNPIFSAGEKNSFDEVSVKDPSVVYYKNTWHLFYTARSNNEYTCGYVSAKKLEDLNKTQRHELKTIRGKTRYGCAPRVFYFEPQHKWYLIFQTRDSNYQPAFSVNSDIAEPEKWSAPKNLIEKDSPKKWIDFWVIADKNKVYLFYTQAHSGVMVRSTNIADFPENWGPAKEVLKDVHEAVHIYKVKDKDTFHMIYELNNNGIRSFGIATSPKPEGPWKKDTDEYASANQLIYRQNQNVWTEMVSHGEIIRSGYNQYLEYNPEDCQWLIQGILKNELDKTYEKRPWQLGIINRVQQ